MLRVFCLAGIYWLSPALAAAQSITTDPDSVRLVVDDIRRLAGALRSLERGGDTIAVLERDYFAHASPGLRAYAERYAVTPATLARALAREPKVYADLNGLADAILAQAGTFRSGFRKLRELYPQAAFPPIWFVVGHMGPAGVARPVGALIAAENYVDHVEDLVPLVLHEIAHIQQAMVQGIETYRRIFGPDQTLLALALREGSADLIAELTTGRHPNPAAHRYGLIHEASLWQRFRQDMHRREPGDWMFVKPSNPEWPVDLGYWIGYRIAKSYFERATDKQRALLDILGLTDFRGFLERSGYAGRDTTPDTSRARP
jgi:hypothetical protein